ncbi:Hsp33 family molecular chaperone HslO [Liquorilactobacillus oeni]|uniref:33 kDa chaperonin n=1 Tax=Liquorilactobacillus oeni DSM 19972 TaxID=1423777 RepID=A0A0R1ME42_9LACO|nr:Hsp33 family molecular chaperone HslO [Liquorilactobacillus oeni]KRL06246.1 Hsp33-like chaperonin [Liquorilactobacillus oeni DSM 19972]
MDYLLKSLAFDEQLRIYAVDTTQTVRKAQKIHGTWSAASAALGRTITATALLSQAVLKEKGKLTVKVLGDGPVGAIVVDGNAMGDIKGYLQHPQVHLPLNKKHKIDVKGAVGERGFLTVTKDLGMKTPFTGQVPLVSGELGEDFAYYLAKSEQIPSAVGLSVFVNKDNTIQTAGGFLIQVMPGASEEILSKIEKTLSKMPSISEMMFKGATPEKILEEICGAENFQLLAREKIKYNCDCSKKRFGYALASIAVKDLDEMIKKNHGAEATCQFCGKKYHFTEEELRNLKEGRNN